jgi:hypothetical protein
VSAIRCHRLQFYRRSRTTTAYHVLVLHIQPSFLGVLRFFVPIKYMETSPDALVYNNPAAIRAAKDIAFGSVRLVSQVT